jgi:hypothetical protein
MAITPILKHSRWQFFHLILRELDFSLLRKNSSMLPFGPAVPLRKNRRQRKEAPKQGFRAHTRLALPQYARQEMRSRLSFGSQLLLQCRSYVTRAGRQPADMSVVPVVSARRPRPSTSPRDTGVSTPLVAQRGEKGSPLGVPPPVRVATCWLDRRQQANLPEKPMLPDQAH